MTTTTIYQLPNSATTDIEATPHKRAVLYLRVSTSKQATLNGEAEG